MLSQLSQLDPWMYPLYAAIFALVVTMGWEILKVIVFILKEIFKDKDTKKK